jgi:hypothetical protein
MPRKREPEQSEGEGESRQVLEWPDCDLSVPPWERPLPRWREQRRRKREEE